MAVENRLRYSIWPIHDEETGEEKGESLLRTGKLPKKAYAWSRKVEKEEWGDCPKVDY